MVETIFLLFSNTRQDSCIYATSSHRIRFDLDKSESVVEKFFNGSTVCNYNVSLSPLIIMNMYNNLAVLNISRLNGILDTSKKI